MTSIKKNHFKLISSIHKKSQNKKIKQKNKIIYILSVVIIFFVIVLIIQSIAIFQYNPEIHQIIEKGSSQNQNIQKKNVDNIKNLQINSKQLFQQNQNLYPSIINTQNDRCRNIPLKFNQTFTQILNTFLNNSSSLIQSAYQDVRIFVDDNDSTVSSIIKYSGSWQDHYLKSFIRLVKKNDVYLNVGSHIGFEAMVLSKKIGQDGRYYFFQPYEKSYNLLKQNIKLNNIQNVSTTYNMAASDVSDKKILNVFYSNTGGSKISSQNNQIKFADVVQKIQSKLVDDVLPEDLKVNFALLDVQFHQLQVLNGMRRVIKRSPDIIIQCQTQQFWNYGKQFQDKWFELIDWLIGQNFSFYYVQFGMPDPVTCKRETFIQITREDLIEKMYSSPGIPIPQTIQLYMMRKHINPNELGYQ